MKGHMEDGKFHPHTEQKGVRKSRDQKAKTQGVKIRFKKNSDGSQFKQIKVWKYEDASDDLQETIIEKWRANHSAQDTFYAEDEGILYDTNVQFAGHEVFKDVIPKFWDVGGGRDYIQFDLELTNEKKFAKYLGVSEKLRGKIDFVFENGHDENTRIGFTSVAGFRIDISNDTGSFAENGFDELPKDQRPTFAEFTSLLRAHDRFADLMDMSLKHLKMNYDNEFHEETIKENIKANDYTFNAEGEIENIERKSRDTSEEDKHRKRKIVGNFQIAKENVEKIGKRKIDSDNSTQHKKKSLALFKANKALRIATDKYEKEFGIRPE